ncbi:MAG: CpaF family protein [Bacillaceae bacterium]|nr:CpaF family protein [Bacillaceae bacterium]
MSSLLQRLKEQQRDLEQEEIQKPDSKIINKFRKDSSGKSKREATKAKSPKEEKYEQIKTRLQNELIKEIKDEDEEGIEKKIEEIASNVLKEETEIKPQEKQRMIRELIDEATGFGPLNDLLVDDDITEIMVNGPDQVYVEKKGKIELSDLKFRDDQHVMNIIEKIVAPLGRRIDESSPMVDARLPDGSRVNAIIPPLALNGPTITIRKFSSDPFTIDDLISFGTLTQEMATFLDACVKAKLNMFVSGGTGSGKTTTLNVLSSFIPSDERIITIEDAAELQLGQEHVVSLETRPPNLEGKGEITIRDLVRNSLRMRPERIVVGEVRGAEALDMLQAMNTGHDGSLGTGHANSPRDMISRLETMVLMAGIELPVRAIREQIAGALDVIVHQSRLRDGSRKITSITEVLGLEGDTIVLQEIFTFKQTGVDEEGKILGQLVPTGIKPHFYERLETSGIHIPSSIFIPGGEW